MNFAHPESLVFWQVILFVITLFLLTKYAWKPILNAVKEREKNINQALASAQEAKKEMAMLKSDNEKLLAQARAERDVILKEAKEAKDKIIAQAKEEAQKQGKIIIENAKEMIEAEKRTAIVDLKKEVASISLEIAQKVVKTELGNAQNQQRLIEQELEKVNFK